MRKKSLGVSMALVMFVAYFVSAPCVMAAEKSEQEEKTMFYIGTYTGQKSKGIYRGLLNQKNGEIELKGIAAQTVNPSFLAIHPNKKFLYAVNESSNIQGKKQGGVAAFSIDDSTGELKELNQVLSGGTGPCHLALDKIGKFLAVANYGSGSVAVFKINTDGSIGEMTDRVQHSGSGPNQRRQEGPHAHWVGFSSDNKLLFACDLGIDKVFIYEFNSENGKIQPAKTPSINLVPGAGPRHMAFHPSGKFAYVINELNSTISTVECDFKKCAFRVIESVRTLPENFTSPNTTAEIAVHPSGDFLYGSNRGHDSIACFRIDRESGKLSLIEIAKCGGKTPRNFEISRDGKFLLCANQGSDNLTIFKIEEKTGKLELTPSTVEVGSPVCIVFLNK